MGLTPRERVMAAFDHVEGDRVPAWCGSSPEFWEKARRYLGLDDEGLRVWLGDDFRRVYASYVGPVPPLSPRATCRTPFGIERHGIGYGMALSTPLAGADVDQVHAYAWPHPDWFDPANITDDAAPYKNQYAILGGAWSPFWHDVCDLLGMDNLMIKMYEDPDLVDAVFEHVVQFYLDVNARIFDAAAPSIDILFIGNDFGSQNGPLVSEHLFRRFILAHLKKFIDLGHAYGKFVMLHCCGSFVDLLPAMIEIGLDGIHAVQPSCRGMDLAALKANFGHRILFNGAIDSHHILIEGTPDLVRQKTREVLDIMKPGGGYVAGASHDSILEETPVENVLAMFEAIRHYGKYEE
ncbi:MAG TPA: uroporphyrinogen decarboxylase family protein [Candidatus Bathyarchaeia archaeon]|nr:uroporphyrinogen decarboxylase family protein [Candidatus Bathyarchaeia archaeon]